MPYRRLAPLPRGAVAVLAFAVLLGCQTVQLSLMQVRTTLAAEAPAAAQGMAHDGEAVAKHIADDPAPPARDHAAHRGGLPDHCPGGGCEVLLSAADALPPPVVGPATAVVAPAPAAGPGRILSLSRISLSGRPPPRAVATPVSLSVLIRT